MKKVRERFWIVTIVDRPFDGDGELPYEKFLTLDEVRQSIVVETGLSVVSIRRAVVPSRAGVK